MRQCPLSLSLSLSLFKQTKLIHRLSSAELSAKDLQFVHIYSPLFKTLKIDEIVNSDKLSQAKNSLSPIKNGMYSLNLNSMNRNSKNYSDSSSTMSSPSSMASPVANGHLVNCVPNQMLITNSVVNNNNNFYPTNDCSPANHDLHSIDSDSLSMLKFWKCDQDNEKSFI